MQSSFKMGEKNDVDALNLNNSDGLPGSSGRHGGLRTCDDDSCLKLYCAESSGDLMLFKDIPTLFSDNPGESLRPKEKLCAANCRSGVAKELRLPTQFLGYFSIAFIEDRPLEAIRADGQAIAFEGTLDSRYYSPPWRTALPESNESIGAVLNCDLDYAKWWDAVSSASIPRPANGLWAATAKTRAEQRQRSLVALLNAKGRVEAAS